MANISYHSILYTIIFIGCTNSLSNEDYERIKILNAELDKTINEIEFAEAIDNQVTGGFAKYSTSMRVRLLKIDSCMIAEKIKEIKSGDTNKTAMHPELADTLKAKIRQQEQKVSVALSNANNSPNDFLGATLHSVAISEELELSFLRHKYLIAKYGLSVPNSTRYLNIKNK